MEYQGNKRTGDRISVLDFGTSYIAEAVGKCVYCNSRCPFRVDQMARMKEIAEYFQ